jgi:hypothetical protein
LGLVVIGQNCLNVLATEKAIEQEKSLFQTHIFSTPQTIQKYAVVIKIVGSNARKWLLNLEKQSPNSIPHAASLYIGFLTFLIR